MLPDHNFWIYETIPEMLPDNRHECQAHMDGSIFGVVDQTRPDQTKPDLVCRPSNLFLQQQKNHAVTIFFPPTKTSFYQEML